MVKKRLDKSWQKVVERLDKLLKTESLLNFKIILIALMKQEIVLEFEVLLLTLSDKNSLLDL